MVDNTDDTQEVPDEVAEESHEEAQTEVHDVEPVQVSDKPGMAGWLKGHKKVAIITAVAVVVLGAGIPTGVWAATEFNRNQVTQAATDDLAAANAIHADAVLSVSTYTEELNQLRDEADTIYVPIYSAVSPYTTLFSPESLEALTADVTEYNEFIAANDITPEPEAPVEGEEAEVTTPVWNLEEPVAVPVTHKELVASYLESEESRKAASKALSNVNKQNKQVVEDNVALKDDLVTIRGKLVEATQEVAASTPALKDAYIAAYPKSGVETHTGLDPHLALLATIADGTFDRVEGVEAIEAAEATDDAEAVVAVEAVPAVNEYTVFKGYIDAAAAITASHDAVVAAEAAAAAEAQRIAEEEAARNSNNNGGTNNGSRSNSSNGSRNNGGTNNNSGGTNPGSGGTNPGTGGGSPSIGPRGSIVRSGSTCAGSGGGASGNWSSNLVAPSNASSVWVTSENRGVSWGIGWSCLSEDW